MPVKGVPALKREIGRWAANVHGPTTEKALKAVLFTAGGHAKLHTPVDTATLINSQYYKLINNNRSGVLAYSAGFADKTGFNYALFLENNVYADGSEVNWKPTKKMDAKPHFLRDAFESEEAQADLISIIINGYKL